MVLGMFVLLAAMIVSAGLGVAVGRFAEHTLARAQARRAAGIPQCTST